MRTYLFSALAGLLLISTFANAQTSKQDSVKKKLDALVEKQILKPVRDIHDKLDLDAFSRAYTTESYVYDIYNDPTAKANYYQCVMKQMKGAFITDKVEFRIDAKTNTITMMDDKTKKFIALYKWLIDYKAKTEAKEKEKKEAK